MLPSSSEEGEVRGGKVGISSYAHCERGEFGTCINIGIKIRLAGARPRRVDPTIHVMSCYILFKWIRVRNFWIDLLNE